MLVGDVILGAAELIPNLPSYLSVPATAQAAAAQASVAGGTLPTASYYVKVTYLNQWGETIPCTNEVGPISITQGTHVIRVTGPALNLVPNATKVRVYFGVASGAQNQYVDSAVLPFDISAPGTSSIPPTRNTSFFPDTDGRMLSAYTIYRWLNEGVEEAVLLAGGLPDVSGFKTINAAPMYEVNGHWRRITDAWWDGWPVSMAGGEDLYYRNILSGVTNRAVLQQLADRLIIELQPQPNRDGGSTTLAANLGLTDTTVQLTASTTFKMPFGLAKVGSEIIHYASISGNNLLNCVRGLGGTTQAASLSGVTVDELNFRFMGLRSWTNPVYAPGDSSKTLPLPPGWKMALIEFILGRAREAEQQYQQSERHMKLFVAKVKDSLRTTRIVVGPRQVGGSTGSRDVYQSAGSWGLYVP